MTALKQPSLAGGVVSPQCYGRTDMAKYATGLKSMENFHVTRLGCGENRAGTIYIDSIQNPTLPTRLVDFTIADDLAYVLVFSVPPAQGTYQSPPTVFRLYNNELPVRPSVATPAWSAGTTYGIGDIITYNGAYYWSRSDGNLAHTPPSTLAWSDAFWYRQPVDGTGVVIEVPTAIPAASLANMQWVQLNDIMNLAEHGFHPQTITRYGLYRWAISPFVAGDPVPPPVIAAKNTDSILYTYVVTVFDGSSVESPAGAPGSIFGATMSATVSNVITWDLVPGSTNFFIYRLESGVYNKIGAATGTTFTDANLISVAINPPLSGGTLSSPDCAITQEGNGTKKYTYAATSIDAESGTESTQGIPVVAYGKPINGDIINKLTWAAVPGADAYNIYRLYNGVYAFVGKTSALFFNDDNITPNVGVQPPVAIPLFDTANDYPAVIGIFQQRTMFANTVNQPQTVWASRVGVSNCFNVGTPVLDADAIQFTIAGRQIQKVRALVDLGKLIVHTSSGEYVCEGNQSGALTPTSINISQTGYAGCSPVVPVVIGNTDLFVQARNTILRDLQFTIQSTTYQGKDTTVFSEHLFQNRSITRASWQQVPNSIVWCVLSDGTVAGLTYIKEHDLWGWHKHSTVNGFIKDIVSVSEFNEDAVYFLVERQINGSTVVYLERMANRAFSNIATDAIFVDCTQTYDGRVTDGTTIALSTGAGWTPTDNITITATASKFAAGDVGDAVVMQLLSTDGLDTVLDQVTLNVISYTSGTVVVAQPTKNVPAWAQTYTGNIVWGKALSTFSGLTPLIGQTVQGLGDGFVIPQTVVNGSGQITTDSSYLVAHIGLPINARLQTLDIENANGETLTNKRKLIHEVTCVFYSSRGGWFGQDFAHLNKFVSRQAGTVDSEPWAQEDYLVTGPYRILIQGTWQTTGSVCIEQRDPLPMGISAIIPTGFIGT